MMKALIPLAGLGSILLASPGVTAQAFPSKPIRIIVPTSPGGLNDQISRTLGQEVSKSVGQPVIVENRAGVGSIIGMAALAKAPGDGYTVGITTAEPLVYNPLLYTSLPYDAEKEFSYLSQLVRTIGIIIAHSSTPGNTFPDVIAYARANPGKLNWATWGPGSTPAIYLGWIERQNGVSITAIPYKGAGPSMPAILANEVQLTYTGLALALPHVRSGKLKALAITGALKADALPRTPHLAKFNSDPGFSSGFGLYGPAGIPMEIQNRLADEFAKALRTPAGMKLTEGSMEPVGSTPAEFAALVKKDRENARRVLAELGIKPKPAP